MAIKWEQVQPGQRTLSAGDLNRVAKVAGDSLNAGGAGASTVGAGGLALRRQGGFGGGTARPAIITAINTTDYGPPTLHTYDGDYIDGRGGDFEDLGVLQDKSGNVRYGLLNVDDHVLVVWGKVAGIWTALGFLRPEHPQFVLCSCS